MPHAPSSALSTRHEIIRRALADLSLDALVVTSLPNITYLTNFAGSAAIVVLTADRLLFITDTRYVTSVREARGTATECHGLELLTLDGSYDAELARTLQRLGRGRIGFEAGHMSVSRHARLTAATSSGAGAGAGQTLVPVERIVERARARKDAYELAVLGEAARRLSVAADRAFAEVRPGRTERQVALAIDVLLREEGFDKPAFDTIVASGPFSALPHARPAERKLTEGDLVVLDFGGVYDSYCVDLTRTVSLGRASARAQEVHTAVLLAHDRAIQAVAPGTSRFGIDHAARMVLEARGMGEAFGHGTGHGLGLEVHEEPRIVRRGPDVDASDEALEAGMVFTIEPGAYFPGWGGVRIEDDVVVTVSGADVLTRVRTDLLEL
jgi:Xaa-Pro aminopeptidase